MTDGTTLCPHCATRFRIAEAQLSSHQGMVRCGHCLQPFDARPNYLPDQPSPQLDLLTDALDTEPDTEQAKVLPDETKQPAEIADTAAEDNAAEPIDAFSLPQSDEPAAGVSMDFSATHLPTQPEVPDVQEKAVASDKHLLHALSEEITENSETTVVTPKRHTWLWATGALALLLLLLAQSAYFFRTPLAARMPALKPALSSTCRLLGCSVSLPQQAELLSIESSSLSADPDHENQVNLDALLRNRGSYAQSFPALSLTLNDMQDKALARRNFQPSDFLPAEESQTRGLAANHEISIKLRMDTAELRPVGYRLELYYPK